MNFYVVILGGLALAGMVKSDFMWSETEEGYEGLIKTGVFELHECLAECLYLVGCTLAAFDDSNLQCYIQFDSEVKPVPKSKDSSLKIYKFNRDDFFTGNICWKKFPGKKIKGLTNISYVPLPQCMTYCVGSKVCNAVSYDTSTDPACWLQLAKDTLYLDQESFESSTTANSYILDKACLGQIEYLPK